MSAAHASSATADAGAVASVGATFPLGATPDADGVNFALVAPNATGVTLCLFDGEVAIDGTWIEDHPERRIALPHCSDGVWHGYLAAAAGGVPGLVYGYRVHGPWAPAQGHRFNPNKLVLDPCAREVLGEYQGQDLFAGHLPGQPELPDPRDNAAWALKAVVPLRSPAAGHALVRPHAPLIPAGERVLYELHVKAHTALHPAVPEPLRGTYAGLACPAVLDHLQSLGVTTLSLMPVQHRADEARLQAMGLRNHWGYNTIAWFAPEARYWSGMPGTTPTSEFRMLVDAVHARGMEVVIDVVYNHSAETDEWGPTLSLRGIDNALYYHLRADNPALYENWSGCGNCLNLTQPRVLQLVMDSLRHWAGPLGVDGFRFDLAPILARNPHAAEPGFDPRAPFFAAITQDPLLAGKLMIAEPWDIGPGGYRLGQFPPGWLEWNDRYRDTQRRYWLHRNLSRGAFAQRFAGSSDSFQHSHRAPTASVNFITAHDGFTLRDLVSYNQRHNLANGEHNRDGHSDNHSTNCGVEGETTDPAVNAKRLALQKALLATLLLSQGTPMLLAGDEIGHSQQGNNNAYCQDNATTWLNWAQADQGLAAFVAALLALRREVPALTGTRWWRGAVQGAAEVDVRWLHPQGHGLAPQDWDEGGSQALMVGWPGAVGGEVLLLVNPEAGPVSFRLPEGVWELLLASDGARPGQRLAGEVAVSSGSVWVCQRAGDEAGVA